MKDASICQYCHVNNQEGSTPIKADFESWCEKCRYKMAPMELLESQNQDNRVLIAQGLQIRTSELDQAVQHESRVPVNSASLWGAMYESWDALVDEFEKVMKEKSKEIIE